jgi:hypothetical protein
VRALWADRDTTGATSPDHDDRTAERWVDRLFGPGRWSASGGGRPRGRPRSPPLIATTSGVASSSRRTTIGAHGPSTSIGDIAPQPGSQAADHETFGDKADSPALTDLVAELIDDMHDLSTGIDRFTQFMVAEPRLYRFLVQSIRSGGTELTQVPLVTALASHVTAELRTAFPDADDAAVHIAAYGLLGMVFAAGDAWLQHASFPREQLVDTLTSLYVDGAARLAMPSTTRTSATNTTAVPTRPQLTHRSGCSHRSPDWMAWTMLRRRPPRCSSAPTARRSTTADAEDHDVTWMRRSAIRRRSPRHRAGSPRLRPEPSRQRGRTTFGICDERTHMQHEHASVRRPGSDGGRQPREATVAGWSSTTASPTGSSR